MKKQRNISKSGKSRSPDANVDSADERAEDETPRWGRRARIVCSLLILFHVAAVFVAPFSGPPPSSIFGRGAGDLFSPYLRTLFIYNGYRFFAPNPGPSHLVRYEVELPSGEKIDGQFPDRDEHWPRLLYHRHFMLSETLFSLNSAIPSKTDFDLRQKEMEQAIERLREERHFDLAEDVAAAKQQGAADYDRLVKQQSLILESIATELSLRHEATNVRLFLAERPLPLPDNIQEAIRNRANGAEPVETRSKPILLVDETRWIEQQVWPELKSENEIPPEPIEEVQPSDEPNQTQPQNPQRPPSLFEGLLEPEPQTEQGRAGQ